MTSLRSHSDPTEQRPAPSPVLDLYSVAVPDRMSAWSDNSPATPAFLRSFPASSPDFPHTGDNQQLVIWLPVPCKTRRPGWLAAFKEAMGVTSLNSFFFRQSHTEHSTSHSRHRGSSLATHTYTRAQVPPGIPASSPAELLWVIHLFIQHG